MNIAIVDDEHIHSNQIAKHIKTWDENRDICNTVIYSSGDALLADNYNHYNIIFMDIQLGKKSGLRISKILRDKGCNMPIVLVTNHKGYGIDGCNVQASGYLLKPVEYVDIAAHLDETLTRIRGGSFYFTYNDSHIFLDFEDILYFASAGHSIAIYMLDGTEHTARMSLKSITNDLPGQFVRCHKSFIVNIRHIRRIKGLELQMKNDCIVDTSRKFKHAVQQAVTAYYTGRIKHI